MPDNRTEIKKLLDAADAEVDAAKRLLVPPINLLVFYHLQQTAEKILKAVRLHRGFINTKEHDLTFLIDGNSVKALPPLPQADPWRVRFQPLEFLAAYATTYRYTLKNQPNPSDPQIALQLLTAHLSTARIELL